MQCLGILSAGGDCPGINAVIRAVVKTAVRENHQVIGFLGGYGGLVEDKWVTLEGERISGLLHRGGTMLGSDNRHDPFHFPVEDNGQIVQRDMSDKVMGTLRKLEIQCLIAIGGDGTMAVTRKMARKGARVISVPKTIDNDLAGTDQTFGFDTALTTATEALDKLHSTAESHHRVMVLELMGRDAGWIAVNSGIAGGADVILIPEIPWSIENVAAKIAERKAKGKHFSVVVVAEGTPDPTGERVIHRRVPDSHEQVRLGGIGQVVGHLIEEHTGTETRVTILGHIQRGGSPSPFDRILATRLGVAAAQAAIRGDSEIMVCLQGWNIGQVPLEQLSGGTRVVPEDGQLVQAAKAIGICFGDEVMPDPDDA